MPLVVAQSDMSDGNMYNRHDMFDQSVIDNRTAFLAAHTIDMRQTTRLKVMFDRQDFCIYSEIDETTKGHGMQDDECIITDALITTHPNHALFLPVADCVGASIYDPDHQVLALAHLGRHSLEQDGASKIIMHLVRHYGSDPSRLHVQLTPAAGKDIYKIWALANMGMKEATLAQLAAAGITPANITDNAVETTSSRNHYSYSEFLKGNRDEDGDHAIVAMMTSK